MKLLSYTVDNVTVNAPVGIPTNGLPKLTEILQVGVSYLLIFVAFLSLLYLIWGGTMWIISGGDKAKIESARRQIMYALIGLFVAFAAFMIVNLVAQFFHANLVK